MLSVQSPGCAGMERLGVPTRTSLGSPPDERSRMGRRMRIEGMNDSYVYGGRQINNSNQRNHNFHSQNDMGEGRLGCPGCSNSQAISCPYHVAMPDSEYTRDRDIQIRVPYQPAEIIRSYIKPPPNKTVSDVPEGCYNRIFSSSSMSAISMDSSSCNSVPHNQHYNNQSASSQPPAPKTKPNALAKFFHKISSSKSPSSSASSSPSSSSSSTSTSSLSTLSSDTSSQTTLSSTSTLPACDITAPTALTGTSFNLGTTLHTVNVSKMQSTISPTNVTSTPCMGVTVPSGYCVQTQGNNRLHHNYHHQNNSRLLTLDHHYHHHHHNHQQVYDPNTQSYGCLAIRVPTPTSSSTQSLASSSSMSSNSMGSIPLSPSPSPSHINDVHRSRSPSTSDGCDSTTHSISSKNDVPAPSASYSCGNTNSDNVNFSKTSSNSINNNQTSDREDRI